MIIYINALPFNMDGTIYKRNCKDLRIKLAGYPNTLFHKVHRRCSGRCNAQAGQAKATPHTPWKVGDFVPSLFSKELLLIDF